jgi:serine O-acetyltransferase
MYRFQTEEEVWDICRTLLEKDSPFSDLGENLMDFRDEFSCVYRRIREEHANINRKYYRTENKSPIVNPLHVAHYTRLIYYFSRELFLKNVDTFILDQLFFSIRTRCNIDLFYEVELKRYFLPEHALGTIVGRAGYDDYFVVCQNCTIGNNKNIYPRFGKGVILRPGAIVLGNCRIGNNVQISAGSLIIDEDIPDNSIVFGRVPRLEIREAKALCTKDFFD